MRMCCAVLILHFTFTFMGFGRHPCPERPCLIEIACVLLLLIAVSGVDLYRQGGYLIVKLLVSAVGSGIWEIWFGTLVIHGLKSLAFTFTLHLADALTQSDLHMRFKPLLVNKFLYWFIKTRVR